MTTTERVLLVLGLLVFAGVSYLFKRLAHNKKVAEIVDHAARSGWHYKKSEPRLVNRFIGHPFGKGHSRKARHVLTGHHRGRAFVAFEYSYKDSTDSDGKKTTTFHHTVVAVVTPAARPTLAVHREGIVNKALGFFGVRDLQLESEEFNKTFLIRTENDRFAYDVLHPRMMAWMLGDQRALSIPFRFERSDIVTSYADTTDLSKIESRLDYLCDIVDRVPSFVWTT